jgi:hypothetical protein
MSLGLSSTLVKLAKLKTVQLIWVPGNMGIEGNEVPEQLAKQGSLLPLTRPGLALGIPTKVAWEVLKGWTSRKRDGYWLLLRGQRQAKGFLTRHC